MGNRFEMPCTDREMYDAEMKEKEMRERKRKAAARKARTVKRRGTDILRAMFSLSGAR